MKSVTASEIKNFLFENGPSTRNQIVAGIKHACVQTVCYRLSEMDLVVSDNHICPLTRKRNKLYSLKPQVVAAMKRWSA